MTTNNLLASINSRIEGIGKNSAAFKVELNLCVRELCVYIPDSGDIGALNRLLSVLNKTDKAMVTEFFVNFLPWKFDTTAQMFTTKTSNTTKLANLSAWIDNKDNTIWEWIKAKRPRPVLTVVEQKKATATRLTNAVERALSKDNKAKLNKDMVIKAITDAGVSLEDILEVVTKALEVKQAEQAKLTASANENMPKPKATRKAAAGK